MCSGGRKALFASLEHISLRSQAESPICKAPSFRERCCIAGSDVPCPYTSVRWNVVRVKTSKWGKNVKRLREKRNRTGKKSGPPLPRRRKLTSRITNGTQQIGQNTSNSTILAQKAIPEVLCFTKVVTGMLSIGQTVCWGVRPISVRT